AFHHGAWHTPCWGALLQLEVDRWHNAPSLSTPDDQRPLGGTLHQFTDAPDIRLRPHGRQDQRVFQSEQRRHSDALVDGVQSRCYGALYILAGTLYRPAAPRP